MLPPAREAGRNCLHSSRPADLLPADAVPPDCGMMSGEGELSSELRRKDLPVPDRHVLFGASLGQWNGADAADAAGRIRLATQADRDGLDLFTVADHPYFGSKLDAYALTGFLLGRTERITGMVTVTNLPSRPAPVLARTLTSLSTLSGGRMFLGIGVPDHHAAGFIYRSPDDTPADEALARWATEVVPAVREAITR